MAGDAAKRRATYADLLALPANQVGELLFGALHALPRPRARHARVSSSLGGELHAPFGRGTGGPGGWILLDEPELHLGEDVLVPDLAGWRREHMPELPDVAAFELAPDWVCEVLSPSTRALDQTDKLSIYRRERVPHVWFLDPEAETLAVHRFSADGYVVVGAWRGEAVVRAEPFEALALPLSVLWAR